MPLTRRSLGLAAAGLVIPPMARAQSGPEILARFPNGTFLENLVVEPDGRVIFTNYFAKRLEAWSAANGHAPLAEVPDHPVSLTQLGGGRQVLAVHGASFMDGPAAMRGKAALLLLAPDGTSTRRIALPEAIFPNGAMLIASGQLLLADSGLGRVWQVDLETGAATTWLDHPLLAPVGGQPHPGVNGIKRVGDALLLSNSAQRSLLRVRLAGSAAQGAPEQVAQMSTGIDDFVMASDGTVYGATHAEGLARLPPGAGTSTTIAAPGVEGSTAVVLTPDGRGLYALGTGGLSSGGRGEAVLARVAIPST
jgi:hypothetical protein